MAEKDEDSKKTVGYEPLNEIEKEAYESLEVDYDSEEKIELFKVECPNCGRESMVSNGVDEFVCPFCDEEEKINWR